MFGVHAINRKSAIASPSWLFSPLRLPPTPLGAEGDRGGRLLFILPRYLEYARSY